MSVKTLQQLFDYSYWANEHLFAVLDQLEPGQFTESVAGSYESIRNTLVHVLSAEWGWLDRCGGPPRGERLKAEDYPTVESLVVAWKRVEENMRAFLSGLNDDDLTREIEFTLGAGPRQRLLLGDLLQHAAVHAAHHRGQVSLLLRMLGHAPGNFDLVLYAGSKQGLSAR